MFNDMIELKVNLLVFLTKAVANSSLSYGIREMIRNERIQITIVIYI